MHAHIASSSRKAPPLSFYEASMAAMADSGDHKKNSILKLALFVGFGDSTDASRPPAARSPRSFAAGDGAVGLAIVAAMSAAEEPARSEPIPIGAVVTKPPKVRAAPAPEKGEEDMELSESYTCVISHLGGNRVKKRVYFGDGGGGLFLEPPPPAPSSPPSEMAEPPPPFLVADFLRCCFLCKKQLDGIDVYMYRGEKAFCSEECRYQQMLLDEFSEKFGSGAMKNYECSSSSSPCSAPLHITAGVAVA